MTRETSVTPARLPSGRRRRSTGGAHPLGVLQPAAHERDALVHALNEPWGEGHRHGGSQRSSGSARRTRREASLILFLDAMSRLRRRPTAVVALFGLWCGQLGDGLGGAGLVGPDLVREQELAAGDSHDRGDDADAEPGEDSGDHEHRCRGPLRG